MVLESFTANSMYSHITDERLVVIFNYFQLSTKYYSLFLAAEQNGGRAKKKVGMHDREAFPPLTKSPVITSYNKCKCSWGANILLIVLKTHFYVVISRCTEMLHLLLARTESLYLHWQPLQQWLKGLCHLHR